MLPSEFKPSLDESDLRSAVDIIVKPPCVCPCMKEHHSTPTLAGIHFMEAFAHPFRHIPSVWRIAEHALSRPILRETILLFRVILITLVIDIIGTGVKREMKFLIQLVKEVLRCCPIAGCTTEVNFRFRISTSLRKADHHRP